MNRRDFLTAASFFAASSHSAGAADQDQQLRLWYREEASEWNEALPVGNGRLGTMVYGGAATEHLQLNEDTLYSDEPGQQDVPIDITKTFDQVIGLLRAGQYGQAEEIMNKQWIGRVWPCYQPLGDLYLDFGHKAEGYTRELDLREAVVRVKYTAGGKEYTREMFASAPDQAIVIRLTGDLTFDARLGSVHPTARVSGAGRDLVMKGKAPGLAVRRTLEWIEQRGDQWKYPELWNKDGSRKPFAKPVLYGDEVGGRGMRFAAHLRVLECDGRAAVIGEKLHVEGARSVVLALSMATSYNGFQKSPSTEGVDEVAKAARLLPAGKSWTALRAAHVADYKKLFDRVSLGFGADTEQAKLPTRDRIEAFANGRDANLAALYFQFGRYLMIAGSRPGTQPLNLQGIWNQEVIPPWASAYTTNINTEMNYWLAEVGNLSECHQPLFQMIDELMVNGRKVAKAMYGRRGWVEHHNTTLWRSAQPVDNAAMPSFWPVGGAWLTLHAWEHYLYTGDVEFLRAKGYPAMKGAAEFLLDWLMDDGMGGLVTPVGVSPEQTFVYGGGKKAGVAQGPTMDMAIIRELFGACVEASKKLNVDAAFRSEIEKALSKLIPYRVGARGQLQEWAADLMESDPKHRHISHLFALHPGTTIGPNGDKKLLAAARRTLELRGDEGTGWSRAWKINFWARIEDGDHAYLMVKNLLHLAKAKSGMQGGGVLSNLFCSHPPFQIDGNFGGAAGIAEMLLQSHDGEIHLLPALPTAWPEGHATGLCARGGFEIDLEWTGGKLKSVTLHSKIGSACRVRYGERTLQLESKRGTAQKLDGNLRYST